MSNSLICIIWLKNYAGYSFVIIVYQEYALIAINIVLRWLNLDCAIGFFPAQKPKTRKYRVT